MTPEHVEDRAALYALGALADDDRAAIDSHLRECSACARAVGAAENDVALIASMEPQQTAPPSLAGRIDRALQIQPLEARRHVRPSVWPFATAIAAGLVLGLLPSAYLWSENRTMLSAMLAQNAVMDRLAGATHRTAAFQSPQGRPDAKVMYAPDGSWYVILIRNASKTLQVAWMHDGEQTMLGSAVPHGDLAMLYLPKSHRMNQLALMDGTRIVAQAQLSYE
jgi:hypothetical protein